MRMYGKTIAVLYLGLALIMPAHAADGVEILYKEPLQQMQIAYRNATGQQRLAQDDQDDAATLRFNAFGRRFDVNLEVNRALLDVAQRARLGSRYEIYRGNIAGIPGSWIRLVISDGVPRGMLWDGVDLMAIDVMSNGIAGTEDAFIYRLRDMLLPPDALQCASAGQPKNAADLANNVISELRANVTRADGATSQIDIAVIADFEFTSANGSNTVAELTTRMNNVDGIFSAQLGVQMNINKIDTFSSNNDPFSDVSNASDLLDELTDYRFDTPAQYSNGLSHLFTGRDLDDTTVGVAYTGALCSRGFGAGLTQGSPDVTLDTLIAAHEFGHNFGAPHDGTDEPPCEDTPQIFLMAPQLNGSSQFSACSISTMEDDVARASCVSAMPGTDVAVVTDGATASVFLDDSETLAFQANSIGSNDASGVTLDITIPAGVTLTSVSPTTGDCTSGAGSVSCTLGAIAAGSGATVSVAFDATSTGNGDFVASVAADVDDNAGNNQATVQLTVQAAVDLLASQPAAAQIALNASTTITANVENRSSIAATDVTLTVTPQAGLDINSVDWSAGSCSVTNNIATCLSGSLAPQLNSELQLGLTGTSAGSRSYTIAVDAAETDRQPSNNEVSGQVTVNSPPDNNSGGGGGSTGRLFLLLLLLSAILIRRRKALEPAMRKSGVHK